MKAPASDILKEPNQQQAAQAADEQTLSLKRRKRRRKAWMLTALHHIGRKST